MASEEAKEAQAQKLLQKRANVVAAKLEANANQGQREQQEEVRQAQTRALVAEVQQNREKPIAAMEDLARHNRTNAQAIREESEKLEMQVRSLSTSQWARARAGFNATQPSRPDHRCYPNVHTR